MTPTQSVRRYLDITEFPALAGTNIEKIRPPLEGLWAEGKPEAFALLARLPNDGLTVVGSRAATAMATACVHQTLRELARLWSGPPLIILSGLARGIDAAAHEAALDQGFPTIAILGTPLSKTYPREHEGLRRRIIQAGGLILTELAEGEATEPWHFVKRNRWLAALGQATWLVQAAHKSGALITAEQAHSIDRTIYVTPATPGHSAFAGNLKLLRDGAPPLWEALDFKASWKSVTLDTRVKMPASDQNQLALALEASGRKSWDLAAAWAWAQTQDWDLVRLSTAVELALVHGLLLDENGHLLKNAEQPDYSTQNHGQKSPRHRRIALQGEDHPEISGS